MNKDYFVTVLEEKRIAWKTCKHSTNDENIYVHKTNWQTLSKINTQNEKSNVKKLYVYLIHLHNDLDFLFYEIV